MVFPPDYVQQSVLLGMYNRVSNWVFYSTIGCYPEYVQQSVLLGMYNGVTGCFPGQQADPEYVQKTTG